MQDHFYIDRSTQTFSDELTAGGLLRLLAELGERLVGDLPRLELIDKGPYYELTCAPALDQGAIEQLEGWLFPAPFLATRSSRKKLPADLPERRVFVVDFEEEREKRGHFFEIFNSLSRTAKGAYFRGESDPALDVMPAAPDPDYDIWRALNSPTALIGYNNLIERWYELQPRAGKALLLLLDLFRQTPNDIDTAREKWRKLARAEGWNDKPDATASQLYNPAQGKGINKSKANSASLANVKSFWMLEWLKAAGFYEFSHTRVPAGSSDRKSYVLAPARIDGKSHRAIMSEFRNKMRTNTAAVLTDILTVIRYLQAFLEHLMIAPPSVATDPFGDLFSSPIRPAHYVRGFHVAFYKDLGNASATMNIAFLNLPGWVVVRGFEDVGRYQSILTEHARIVRQLREDRGEELELLQCYRDFIVADDLHLFFAFTNRYGGYVISQRERNLPVRQFTTSNLRRLIVSSEPQYHHILDSEGFQNVAYAIRQSTVIAQWRKSQGDRRYDVRYGLGQEFVRKSQYRADFLAALGDFVHRYNAENAQVMENRPGPYRRSIKTTDIAEIAALVDEYGSDLICKLLVAYGYAREPRSSDSNNESEASQQPESSLEVK